MSDTETPTIPKKSSTRNQHSHRIPIRGDGYEASITVKAQSTSSLGVAINDAMARLQALKQVHGIAD